MSIGKMSAIVMAPYSYSTCVFSIIKTYAFLSEIFHN